MKNNIKKTLLFVLIFMLNITVLNARTTYYKEIYLIGDEIKFLDSSGNETQMFNVIEDSNANKSNVRMLAKYNLNYTDYDKNIEVRDNPNVEANVQHESIKAWCGNNCPNYGRTSFYTNKYWVTEDITYPKYIFDNNSVPYSVVSDYKDYINTYNNNVISDFSLLSYEDATNLGCKVGVTDSCTYKWLYNTTFWLGSAASNSNIYYINTDKFFSSVGDVSGVRPVLTMNKEFNYYEYTVNTSVKNNVGGTISATTNVREKNSHTITLSAEDGYKVKALLVNGVDKTNEITNNEYTINSVARDYNIEVEYELYHTVNVNTTNGTLNITDGYLVGDNTDLEIEFIPDEGYELDTFLVNQNDQTQSVSNNKYTLSNVTTDLTIDVTYHKKSFIINIDTYTNGTLNINNGDSILYGENKTINFTPDYGYELTSLLIDGVEHINDVTNDAYTLENITSNKTITPVFELKKYSVNTIINGNGSLDITNETKITHAENKTINITPSIGFEFKSLKINDVDVTENVTNNSYTILSVTSDTNIEATFEKIKLNLTSEINLGTINIDNNIVEYGDNYEIIITPEEGYEIKSLLVNDTKVTPVDNKYTIENITENTNVKATLGIIEYSVSVNSENGRLNIDNNTVIEYNESLELVIVPDNGYLFKTLIINDIDVTNMVVNNKYSLNNIKNNLDVEVIYEKKTYLIRTTTDNSKLNISDNTIVTHGTNKELSIKVNEGYKLKKVTINDLDITSSIIDNKYLLLSIDRDLDIVVTCEKIINQEKPIETPSDKEEQITSPIPNISTKPTQTTTAKKETKYYEVKVITFKNNILDTVNTVKVKENGLYELNIDELKGYTLGDVYVNKTICPDITDNKISVNNIKEDTLIEIMYNHNGYKVNSKNVVYNNKDIVLNVNHDYELLKAVYVNNELLSSTKYTFDEESVVLKNEYLSTLKPGTYEVKLSYTNDSEIKSSFIVVDGEKEEKDYRTLYIAIALIVFGVCTGLAIIIKNRSESKKIDNAFEDDETRTQRYNKKNKKNKNHIEEKTE